MSSVTVTSECRWAGDSLIDKQHSGTVQAARSHSVRFVTKILTTMLFNRLKLTPVVRLHGGCTASAQDKQPARFLRYTGAA
jgi:hypothetical protein